MSIFRYKSSTRFMLDQDPIAPSEPLFKKTGLDEY